MWRKSLVLPLVRRLRLLNIKRQYRWLEATLHRDRLRQAFVLGRFALIRRRYSTQHANTSQKDEPQHKETQNDTHTSAKKHPELRTYLHRFFMKIHPDFFQSQPSYKEINQASLQQLNAILGAYTEAIDYFKQKRSENEKNTPPQRALPSNITLEFWIRSEQHFKLIQTTFNLPDPHFSQGSDYHAVMGSQVETGIKELLAQAAIEIPPAVFEQTEHHWRAWAKQRRSVRKHKQHQYDWTSDLEDVRSESFNKTFMIELRRYLLRNTPSMLHTVSQESLREYLRRPLTQQEEELKKYLITPEAKHELERRIQGLLRRDLIFSRDISPAQLEQAIATLRANALALRFHEWCDIPIMFTRRVLPPPLSAGVFANSMVSSSASSSASSVTVRERTVAALVAGGRQPGLTLANNLYAMDQPAGFVRLPYDFTVDEAQYYLNQYLPAIREARMLIRERAALLADLRRAASDELGVEMVEIKGHLLDAVDPLERLLNLAESLRRYPLQHVKLVITPPPSLAELEYRHAEVTRRARAAREYEQSRPRPAGPTRGPLAAPPPSAVAAAERAGRIFLDFYDRSLHIPIDFTESELLDFMEVNKGRLRLLNNAMSAFLAHIDKINTRLEAIQQVLEARVSVSTKLLDRVDLQLLALDTLESNLDILKQYHLKGTTIILSDHYGVNHKDGKLSVPYNFTVEGLSAFLSDWLDQVKARQAVSMLLKENEKKLREQ